MVSVFASSVVDRGFELQSGQAKAYAICIYCSTKYAALRGREKTGWLVYRVRYSSELMWLPVYF
jgi:hypothetical protein